MLGEQMEDLPRIAFHRLLLILASPQIFELDAVAGKHPEQVMIQDQKQFRGIGKCDIVRIPPGIGVPVRQSDRWANP